MKVARWLILMLCLGALASVTQADASPHKSSGLVRIVLNGVDTLDPAISYSGVGAALVDATCARLLTYSHEPTPRLRPEVATGFPRASADWKTFTFTLRNGFRFSNGAPVRADAFAHAVARTLVPALGSPLAQYTRDISRVVAQGRTLVVHLKRPVPDFPDRSTLLCAVPPTLPADPEGRSAYPAAGPYYVSEYEPGVKAELRRNPFYGGKRPHHVDGFTVDLTPTSQEEVLDRVQRNEADWGWALADRYFDPQRRLVAKYGVNRSRFFLSRGFELRGYVLNSSRPLFADNPRLRQAVNFAIDRKALVRFFGGPLAVHATDQYLLPHMRGFRDATIYPLGRPDLARARALASGHLRSGKAVLYTPDRVPLIAAAQSIKRDLAKIGLDVTIKPLPLNAYFPKVARSGQFDIGFMPWIPDFDDPYAVLNVLFDGQAIGAFNWSRFNSPGYNRLLRKTELLHGPGRYSAYAALDAKLARDAAPEVAVAALEEPTLVSNRIGCVSHPFDLAAVCLK